MKALREGYNELWTGGLKLIRKSGAFPLGMDAVLLAAFAGVIPARRVCDLGCGSGIIALLLLWNDAEKTALGIEIQKAVADIAAKNAEINGMAERFSAVSGDLRDFRSIGGAGGFDLTVANPPYYPVGGGKSSADAGAAAARDERFCGLKDVCAAAAYFTRTGGRFAMVHRPERLSEALCALTDEGLEPKRLRLVQVSAGDAPCLFLVECRRAGRRGLKFEPPLILKDGNGCDTDEVRRIYHLKDRMEN